MPEETVQTLAVIGAAEAEHMFTATDDLMVTVASGAYCMTTGPVRMDDWTAPPESHEHIPQHRYDERVAMVAARLCAPCPVKTECLVAALRLPGYYAAWIRGGMTPVQRHLTLDDAIETVEEGR